MYLYTYIVHDMRIKNKINLVSKSRPKNFILNQNLFCNLSNFSSLIVNVKNWILYIIKTQYRYKTNLLRSFHFKTCKPVNKK